MDIKNDSGFYIQTLCGIIGIIPVVISFYKFIQLKRLHTIIEQLFDIFKNGVAIVTKAELKYQIKCYTHVKFKKIKLTSENSKINSTSEDSKPISIKNLIQEIKKKECNIRLIIGKPASGKTTAMRYLYCSLAKKCTCRYIHMKHVKTIEDIITQINLQKNHITIPCKQKILFIDGFDEAINFRHNDTYSKTFESMFLNGIESKIYKLLEEPFGKPDCIIISLRQECLESLISVLSYHFENININAFILEPMNQRNIIKTFKSLKTLQRIEKKSNNENLRHADRYPPLYEEWKYIWLFKKILKNHPDSIFCYPMYIRYAYAFMKIYGNQWRSNLTPIDSMAASLDVIINAVLKWEFHIYYDISYNTNEGDEFTKEMDKCLTDIIQKMISSEEKIQQISREELTQILTNDYYGNNDKFVIAHCLMTSNDSGDILEFCHSTFYDYYLAKYLLEKGDYNLRKRFLLEETTTQFFKKIYYEMFCKYNNKNYHKFSENIYGIGKRDMNLNDCIQLEKEKSIHIVENSTVYMTEILSYFPFIQKFVYRNFTFSKETLEQMMNGTMDLQGVNWNCLRYAKALAPENSIIELNLHGLPLSDIGVLRNYSALKRLDIRLNSNFLLTVYSAFDILKSFHLDWIYVYDENGEICEKINDLLNHKEIFIEEIFVEPKQYSIAYCKLYQLSKGNENLEGIRRFYIGTRSSEECAYCIFKQIQENKKVNIDIDIFKAVFELEVDSNGKLGLQLHEKSTLWNGLSLALCYINEDSIDGINDAYKILSIIEPFIKKDEKELSVYFAKVFEIVKEKIKGLT